ncbi:uncharacterized protein [Henckelia pumila]|uniref:uncharacterized protein n=1 Tax=Henckelia pumila TaxID=405737 RepID=UPI003C6E5F17
MGESLHEYWECFKKLCARCPQHQISENLLIQYCYEGLLSHDRSMLDANSGGVFVDKTPVQARNLIENMAANSQQFGTNRSDPTPRKSNEVNVSSLEQKLSKLTSLVRHMTVGNGQIARVCGICTQVGHATNMCPTLQEGSAEQVNAAGGFPGPPQQKYDPYSNTYNPGWRDHPNLRYGNPPANQAYRPPNPPPQRPPIPTPGESLENIVQNLATNTMSFQQDTRTSIQNLNTQMGQLVAAISKLEAQNSSRLPSQTVVNPKENVSAITLRSGKELQIQDKLVKETVETEREKESKVKEREPIPKEAPRGKFLPLSEYKPVAPFPLALKDSRKNEGIKELYETFRRREVNIPMLDAIKQVSAVIQRKVTTKFKDPGMFSIPCQIGGVQLDTTMLNLGASINVMPYSVYASLNLGPLNETDIVIQMADRSTIFPRGLLEDVLVEVGDLVFPADFYVLDMKSNELNSPILLGRPFLKTSKSIIDVDNGNLTMEFDGKIAKFDIFDTLKIPARESVVNILVTPAEISTAEKFFSDMQALKTATKCPPDNAKRMPMRKEKRGQGASTFKKLTQQMLGTKFFGKCFKWVKVDKGTKFKPP